MLKEIVREVAKMKYAFEQIAANYRNVLNEKVAELEQSLHEQVLAFEKEWKCGIGFNHPTPSQIRRQNKRFILSECHSLSGAWNRAIQLLNLDAQDYPNPFLPSS